MKKLLLFVAIILSVRTATAQTGEKDSLLQWLQIQEPGQGRVNTLLKLAFLLRVSKPDSCIQLAIEANSESQKINYSKGIARSLFDIGIGYVIIGNYPKALSFALQSLKQYEQIGDTGGIVNAYNLIGRSYTEQGDYREALTYFLKGASIQKRLDILLNSSDTYTELKMLDSARIFAQEGLALAYQTKKSDLSWAQKTMANVYSLAGEYAIALDYYRMSFAGFVKNQNKLSLSAVYASMAEIYSKTGKKDSSFHYARLSLSVAQEAGIQKRVLKACALLSALYEDEHNIDSALFYTKQAKAVNDSLFNQQRLSQIQSLTFDERFRQKEKEAEELRTEQNRKHNLQYAAIAVAVLTFIIFFVLFSRSILANQRLIKFLGILALLVVFEFFNLLLHPYIGNLTNHHPAMMLGIMVCVAALLIPLHHKLDHWVTHKLVEKNNRIRLAAAKKTIQKLEGEVSKE